MEFDILNLILSFAGGIFGASIGAFPVWILCGFAVLIGATLNLSVGDSRFMELIAWGYFLGPHTSFAGGTAAAAYAARNGWLDDGRNISYPLISLEKPLILFVGGVFGGLGYLIYWIIMSIPNYSDYPWTNTIALAVVINMIIVRYIFGNGNLFGKRKKGLNCWKPTSDHSWIIYQSSPLMLFILGCSIAVPASLFTLLLPNSGGLIFGFVTVLLIFMLMGYKVPVTHHIALSASMVTAVTGNIFWGILFGLLAALLGELAAALFVYYGDTHIDPPSVALIFTFTLYPLLEICDMFNGLFFIKCIVFSVIVLLGYYFLYKLQEKDEKL